MQNAVPPGNTPAILRSGLNQMRGDQSDGSSFAVSQQWVWHNAPSSVASQTTVYIRGTECRSLSQKAPARGMLAVCFMVQNVLVFVSTITHFFGDGALTGNVFPVRI